MIGVGQRRIVAEGCFSKVGEEIGAWVVRRGEAAIPGGEIVEPVEVREGTDREFDERRIECMEKCLQALPSEERDLIVKNCILDKKGKEELAKSLGLTMNALRIRAFRIRMRLHECREKCVNST